MNESDFYSEEGLETLEDEDEYTTEELGFMQGYLDS